VAKVMVARRLAVRLYWMLRNGWTYAELARHAGKPGSFRGEQIDGMIPKRNPQSRRTLKQRPSLIGTLSSPCYNSGEIGSDGVGRSYALPGPNSSNYWPLAVV
jgi:hypothetical protein